MKLRRDDRPGASAYQRLIASVVAGDAPQTGDATIEGPNGRRDALLGRYAGKQHRTITADEFREKGRHDPENPPPEPQQ